jgi:hypothetical protein
MRTLDNPSSHCIIGLLMRNKGADERTRTADLVSLRVCLSTFQPMLVRTEIVLFWAVFGNLEASLCPVRTSLVAVRLVVEHREASNGCSGLRWPFPDQAC